MTLLTHIECQAVYGPPEQERAMVLWDVPAELEIGVIPKRIYCNRGIIEPLTNALHALIITGHINELKTWDGCFNIRRKRGSGTPSLHSWGVAIDVNAAWNRFGAPPTLSTGFVECFTKNGFDWGGTWRKPDGQHFQLRRDIVV